MIKKINRKKAGVTLAETVVAIALIAIVSVMAVSISISSFNAEKKNLLDMQIAHLSSTAVDCFRFADDSEEFLSLLQTANENFIEKEGNITLAEKDYTLILTVNSNILTISAKDKEDEEIYSITYKKLI